MSKADWGGWVASLRHELVPDWFDDLPIAVRIGCYYLLFTILLFIVHAALRRMVTVVGSVVAGGARLAGRLVVFHGPEFAEIFALFAVLARSWQRSLAAPELDRWNDKLTVTVGENFQRKRTTRATLRLVVLATLNGLVVAMTMVAGIALLPVLLALVIVLMGFRLHIYNLIALTAALWYGGVLHGVVSKATDTINNRTSIALLLAAGTIIAAMYAAMNVDIRGRAELNKTASVNCRLMLLKCTPALIEAANSLAALRFAVAQGLRAFPTAAEVRGLTGRDDVTLHEGRSLLPKLATAYYNSAYYTSELAADLPSSGGLPSVVTEVGLSESPYSLVRTDEVADVLSRLEGARTRIDTELDNIFDAGLTGKLERILGNLAQVSLALTANEDFGLRTAEAVLVPDGVSTFEFLFGENSECSYSAGSVVGAGCVNGT